MSGSVNKVILIGNLGADPEMRFTKAGTAVCNIRLATNEGYKDKEGVWQEKTEWHRVIVWGKQAETCGEYLKKGRQAYIEGRIGTREWEDDNGNKRQITEVTADKVTFLGGATGSKGGGADRRRGGQSDFPPF